MTGETLIQHAGACNLAGWRMSEVQDLVVLVERLHSRLALEPGQEIGERLLVPASAVRVHDMHRGSWARLISRDTFQNAVVNSSGNRPRHPDQAEPR